MQIGDHKSTVEKAIAAVTARRHRLIVISSATGIKQDDLDNIGFAAINLNMLLSTKLKDIAESARARTVTKCMDDILRQYTAAKILVFSRFEILFLPELKLEPIRLFETISKEQIVILLWPGACEQGILSYAEPWHREYREYAGIDAIII